MRILGTLFLMVILTGCATKSKVMDSWIGSTKHSLILAWGAPSRTADDGDGGEILIYTRHVYAPSINFHYWEYEMMYVNKNGIIYHWHLSRQSHAPTEVDVRFIN